MNLNAIKKLLLSPRPSDEYLAGIEGFLEFAYREKNPNDKIRCLCKKCVNKWLLRRDEVYDHLVYNGMLLGYNPWGCHGETASFISANSEIKSQNRIDNNMQQLVQDAFGNTGSSPPVNDYDAPTSSNSGPDSETKVFYDLLRDAHEPLWEGCELTRLSFLVVLFYIKSINKWSNKSLNDLLAILQQAIPNGKSLPRTFVEARKIMGKLGLNYVKIHVCPKKLSTLPERQGK